MSHRDQLAPFLDALKSSAPTPGGGAVAGLTGALAAALAHMVGSLTIGKKKYAEVEADFQAALPKLDSAIAGFQDLAEEDVEAFEGVMASYRLPKANAEEKAARSAAIQAATLIAAKAPMKTLTLCRELLAPTRLAASSGNAHAVSDAAIAALLIGCTAKSAALNVKINLNALKGPEADALGEELGTLLPAILSEAEAIEAIASERI